MTSAAGAWESHAARPGAVVAVLASPCVLVGAGELRSATRCCSALAGAALGALAVAVVTCCAGARGRGRTGAVPGSGRARAARDGPAAGAQRRQPAAGRRSPRATGSAATTPRGPCRPLPPGGTATYHYELPTRRRGRLQVGPLTLERTDPLGLARPGRRRGDRRRCGCTRGAIPSARSAAASSAPPRRAHRRGLRCAAPSTCARCASTCPATRCATCTGRRRPATGQLMVREYVDPDQPRFTVLLDNRRGVLPAAAFEEAVEVGRVAAVRGGRRRQHRRLRTTTGMTSATAGGGPRCGGCSTGCATSEQVAHPAGEAIPEGGGTLVISSAGRPPPRRRWPRCAALPGAGRGRPLAEARLRRPGAASPGGRAAGRSAHGTR